MNLATLCSLQELSFLEVQKCFYSQQATQPTQLELIESNWMLVKRILVDPKLARAWRLATSQFDASGIKNADKSFQSELTFGTPPPIFFFLPDFYVSIENLGHQTADQLHLEVSFENQAIEFNQRTYRTQSTEKTKSYLRTHCKTLNDLSARRLICERTLRVDAEEFSNYPYDGAVISYEEFLPFTKPWIDL